MNFNLSDNAKGYLWTFLSILTVSNVYIFSKVALNEIYIIQFGFYWFGMGLFWNLVLSNKRIGVSKFKELNRKHVLLFIFLGLLEIVSAAGFFLGIMTIENPSVTSFLGNLSPIFVTILGVIVLKERFNSIEIVGVILTLLGAFVISFKSNSTVNSLFLNGTQYILLSSSVIAVNTILIKKYIKRLSPALLSLNRIVFIFTFATIVMFITNQSFIIPKKAFYAITIGSLLGPFLTVIASYNALKYIEASKKTILSSSRSLFVMLGAYFYFGKLPMKYQIIGGIVTILGILLISFGKMLLKKSKQS